MHPLKIYSKKLSVALTFFPMEISKRLQIPHKKESTILLQLDPTKWAPF